MSLVVKRWGSDLLQKIKREPPSVEQSQLKKINNEVREDVKEKKAGAANLTFENPMESADVEAQPSGENENKVAEQPLPPSIFSHLDAKTTEMAKALLKRLNVDNYEGGTVKIDNYTYNYDQLYDIIQVLYGKETLKKKTQFKRMKLRKFCQSIERRKLHSLVKHKKYLNKIPWHKL